MLAFAENKRRFLAGFAAVVVLVAIRFTIGWSTGSSSPTAGAAQSPTQVAVIALLRGQLASTRQQLVTARGNVATVNGELTAERQHDANLKSGESRAGAKLAAAGRCASTLHGKQYRQCVEAALR